MGVDWSKFCTGQASFDKYKYVFHSEKSQSFSKFDLMFITSNLSKDNFKMLGPIPDIIGSCIAILKHQFNFQFYLLKKTNFRFFEVCTYPSIHNFELEAPPCNAISESRPLLRNTSSEAGALPLEVLIENDSDHFSPHFMLPCSL